MTYLFSINNLGVIIIKTLTSIPIRNKSSNTLLTKPVILTYKNKDIMDYNFFATYVFPEIHKVKNISQLNYSDMPFFYISLSDCDLYLIGDEGITDSFFKNMIDHAFDEFFVADAKGTTIYCNETFEKNYGIKRVDLIGKNVNYVLENNHVDVLLFDKVVEKKETITYKQKTITGRTILNTSSPILDIDGNVSYVIENCRDITENEFLYNTLNYTKAQLEKENAIKSKQDGLKNNFSNFKSEIMKDILSKSIRFSNKDVNILITGPSGTGKTSLARFIHENSPRKDKPFVNINCTTIPENLIESELFGYKKGAFTGALNSGKKGLVEQAEGGTLFLDEIAEIPLNIQSKLLELVQEKQYLPIGSTSKKTADIRIITATNCHLEELVEQKLFRKDLFYRLNVVQITMPALSSRHEDIEVLVEHFISYFNNKYNTNVYMPKDVITSLNNYSWPGNIRELEYLIEYLVINTQHDEITLGDLPKNIISNSEIDDKKSEFSIDLTNDIKNQDYKSLMEMAEEKIIKSYYASCKSSYKLAKALNISQSTANRLINKYCK